MPNKPPTKNRPRAQPEGGGKDPSPQTRSPSGGRAGRSVIRYAKSLRLSKDQMPGSGERRSVRG